MSSQTFKIKFKQGTAEFEAEGSQQFVEKHLQAFKPLLNLPGIKETKPGRKPGRKARKAKPAAKAYPADAVESLQAFLTKAKPKGQPTTAVALGMHHVKHFKTSSFTNQDLKSAAEAVGFKFTNLPLSLMSAAKQGKIRKVKKGTWRLANPETKTAQKGPAKKRSAKPNPAAKKAKPARGKKPVQVSKPARIKRATSAKKRVSATKVEQPPIPSPTEKAPL